MCLQLVRYYARWIYLYSGHSALNLVEVNGVLVSRYQLTMRRSCVHAACRIILLFVVTVNLLLLIVEHLISTDTWQLFRRLDDLCEVRRYGSLRDEEFAALS